jgi:hypothetical protein
MLWWFAADWVVARHKFKERRTLPVQLFDIQMRNIEAALPDIRTLFSSHLVYALPSTGIYTPPDEIWDSMLDTLAGPAGQTLGLPAHVHVRHSPRQKIALLLGGRKSHDGGSRIRKPGAAVRCL